MTAPGEWVIRGYDGLEQVFEMNEPSSNLTDGGITLLLQCLVARNLDDHELLAACRRGKVKGYSDFLKVTRSGGGPDGAYIYSAGNNPHYIATVTPQKWGMITNPADSHANDNV